MEKLSKTVQDRLKAGQAGDHPDANLLAAFAEQTLLDREREQLLTHLSRCADCRDVVALATPVVVTPAALDTRNASWVSWFSWPVLRWGALAACVVIVGTAVLLNMREFQTASLREAAEAPVPALATPQASGDAADASLVANSPAMEEKTVPQMAQHGRMQTRGLKSAPVLAPPASRATSADKETLALDLRKKSEGSISSNGPTAGYGGNGVVGGLVAQQPKPPAPTPAQISGARDDARVTALEGRKVANFPTAPNPNSPAQTVTANETVHVQAEAGAVTVEPDALTEAKREPGKAKQATGTATGLASSGMDTLTLHKEAAASASERARGFYSPATRWTISSDGQLQHSTDAGRSWQPVVVADNATFRALSFNGPDVWVGGAAGLLYHSTDSGGHWLKVSPMVNGAILVADISAIEFTDPRHGKVTTSKGEMWLTDDGGQSWHKQS